jgi:hypothetical protein
MPIALEIGLLTAGPFVAIALVARATAFRPLPLALTAITGELLGILIWALVNKFLVARVLSGKAEGLVVFFPPSTEGHSLSTLVFIIAYALVAAAIVLLGRWAYLRARREAAS